MKKYFREKSVIIVYINNKNLIIYNDYGNKILTWFRRRQFVS